MPKAARLADMGIFRIFLRIKGISSIDKGKP
jgi:hypothetical protein